MGSSPPLDPKTKKIWKKERILNGQQNARNSRNSNYIEAEPDKGLEKRYTEKWYYKNDHTNGALTVINTTREEFENRV